MKAQRQPRSIDTPVLIGLIVLFFLSILALGPEDAASLTKQVRPGTLFDGRLENGLLHVKILLADHQAAPGQDAKPQLWIADLSKTPVAVAREVAYLPNEHAITAQFPASGWNPANRALYSLWYKMGSGSDQKPSAAGLREVFGSMKINLFAPSTYQIGSRGSLRVAVAERHSNRPLSGVIVAANLVSEGLTRPLFEASTDPEGTFSVDFPVPDDLGDSATLEVTATRGDETLKETATVSFKRVERILLTSDKPLYQPGQVIHIRSLTLSAATRQPIGHMKATIEVEDGKGNKVFKQSGQTDRYGVYAADFQLAHELNMGTYRLRTSVGDQSVDKTVEVKRYVLPKFRIAIDTDEKFYKPGQTVTGTIDAQYVFGKPASGARVTLTGYASVVGAEKFAEISGVTDQTGKYAFEMKLPDYFAGQDVDSGLARAQFHAKVVDKADHAQEALKSVTVSASALNAILVPESGSLVQGVPNRLFVMVSRPDGSPAAATVKDPWEKDRLHQTDSLGIVTLTTPEISGGIQFQLEASDERGNQFARPYNLYPNYDSKILLRADKPVYRVGDEMTLTAVAASPASNTVYVDLINNNQTVFTEAIDLEKGSAQARIPVTPEMCGTLILHAYIIEPNGNLVRDTRIVYVNSADDLQIGITPSQKQFRPGQKAQIDFSVTDSAGHPVAAALGVTIVDEAVFALQDMQPGFEKVFFMLEKELMKPRYEFHSFSPEMLVQEPKMDDARARGYEVMLASIEPAVSYGIRMQKAVPLSETEKNAMLDQVQADMGQVNAELRQMMKEGAKENEAVGSLQKNPPLDSWGMPYTVRQYYKGQVLQIASSGPDRVWYTDDDLWAQDPEMAREWSKNVKYKSLRGVGGAGGGRFGAARQARAEGNMIFEEMEMAEAPMAGAMAVDAIKDMPTKKAEDNGGKGGENRNGQGIRVRKFFPETLYTNPALITNDRGEASISLDMADSITTWRVGAMANSAAGLLGSTSAPIVVFQDFFVDIDFPVALTRNDEVTVPIALYNYLKKPQTIALTIEKSNWYELLEGEHERKLKMEPGEVRAVTLKLRAKKVGKHDLTVFAKGARLSDAVKRSVAVEPNGQRQEQVFSDRLDKNVTHEIIVPDNEFVDAAQLFVKIYPGLMSQVIEGLDSILRMPGGCFEQTSSSTYPNIMVLDYMKTTGKITPEIRMKAEGFINQGYQRLLAFEVPGGGFEWFGNAPAHQVLTAYGLMEFFDMSRVHNVDPAVIARTQQWLAGRQKADGSWEPNKHYLDTVASKFADDVTRNTAYIAWALAKSNYKGDGLNKALDYIAKNMAKSEDAYTLALIANAFANAEGRVKDFETVMDKLMSLRKEKDGAVYWQAEDTSIGSRGASADIETTALVGQALVLMDRSPQVVNGIIKYLAQNKDSFGNWHSTQATVYALKVMILSAEKSVGNVNGEVAVRVNGQTAGGVAVTPDNADVLKLIDATPLLRIGKNIVEISFGGEGQTMYQVVGRTYMPWEIKTSRLEALSIAVDYDKTTLRQDDMATCNVKIENAARGDFGMVVIDLGIPPGFEVQTGDLAELVGSKTIAKFETTGRQVIVYLDEVAKDKPISFSYRLRAKFPVRAQTPATKAYQYYNPAVSATVDPVEMVVTQ